MARAWIGVGLDMPIAATAARVAGRSCSSANDAAAATNGRGLREEMRKRNSACRVDSLAMTRIWPVNATYWQRGEKDFRVEFRA